MSDQEISKMPDIKSDTSKISKYICESISLGLISKKEAGKKEAKIVSRGRIRARRCIKGSRRKWLKNADEISVYGHGDEWAVTSEGFIQMKYIEMEDE